MFAWFCLMADPAGLHASEPEIPAEVTVAAHTLAWLVDPDQKPVWADAGDSFTKMWFPRMRQSILDTYPDRIPVILMGEKKTYLEYDRKTGKLTSVEAVEPNAPLKPLRLTVAIGTGNRTAVRLASFGHHETMFMIRMTEEKDLKQIIVIRHTLYD